LTSPVADGRSCIWFLSPKTWSGRFRASSSTTPRQCRGAAAASRSSRRRWTDGRSSWRGIRCIQLRRAPPIHLFRRQSLIFTIPRARSGLSRKGNAPHAKSLRNFSPIFARDYSTNAARALLFSWKKLTRRHACVYEPRLSYESNAAIQTAFGPNARLLPRLDRADVILALDSDFLDCGQADLE